MPGTLSMTYVDSLKLTDLYCDNLDFSSHFYVQVNLDFSLEHDMIRKFRAGLTLQLVSISIVLCDNLFVVLK
jgi:gamma-glutamylcysteine synthetase